MNHTGSLGYETNKIPLGAKWESKESFLAIDGNKLTLQASPYSLPFDGTRKAIVVRNLEELERVECEDKILFLTEDLAQESYSRKIIHSIIQMSIKQLLIA